VSLTQPEPATRLTSLRAARKRAKPKDECNFDEMAKVVGVSSRGLKKAIGDDPNVPMLQRGSEGVPYRFNVRATLDYLIAKHVAAQNRRKAQAVRLQRLSGVGGKAAVAAIEESDEGLSIADLRTVGQITMDQHRLRLQQGRYVVADDTLAFLDDYHSHLQSETLGLLSKIDPAGQWDAQVRLSVEGAMRTLLVNLQGRMERFVASHNVKLAA